MKPDSAGVKTLAVGLLGSLTKKVDMTFAVCRADYLPKNGYELAPWLTTELAVAVEQRP